MKVRMYNRKANEICDSSAIITCLIKDPYTRSELYSSEGIDYMEEGNGFKFTIEKVKLEISEEQGAFYYLVFHLSDYFHRHKVFRYEFPLQSIDPLSKFPVHESFLFSKDGNYIIVFGEMAEILSVEKDETFFSTIKRKMMMKKSPKYKEFQEKGFIVLMEKPSEEQRKERIAPKILFLIKRKDAIFFNNENIITEEEAMELIKKYD